MKNYNATKAKLSDEEIRNELITSGLIKPGTVDSVAQSCSGGCGGEFGRLASRPWDTTCGSCLYPKRPDPIRLKAAA